jgi:hypothetical protein
MRNEQIDAIRKACIAAIPEIETTEPIPCPDGMPGCAAYHSRRVARPIRLADVLLAMIASAHYPRLGTSGSALVFFAEDNGTVLAIWNLFKDDLTAQSDETIAFIHSLIV